MPYRMFFAISYPFCRIPPKTPIEKCPTLWAHYKRPFGIENSSLANPHTSPVISLRGDCRQQYEATDAPVLKPGRHG
jgi:hypothetical protein